MKHIIIAIAAALSLTLAACGSSSSDSSSNAATPDSDAVEMAQRQARLLIEAQPDTAAMQHILLETRGNEQKLRAAGLNSAADAYIAAFEDYLRTNAPNLASNL